MNILGLSCFYHDSAACLVQDGRIAAAVQEERLTREKGTADFPVAAITACLDHAGLSLLDIDQVAFYERPYAKFERALAGHIQSWPFSLSNFMANMPGWLGERLSLPHILRDRLAVEPPVSYVRHHLAHAASAFLTSPFDRAAILTVDGVGEWATTAWGVGHGSRIDMKRELHYPDSLGLVYSAITSYLGFRANRGEGKVMALADFGEPAYLDELRKLVRVAEDGSYRVDDRFFGFNRGRRMYSRKFVKRFGPPREVGAPLEQRHRDMAASLQQLLEEALVTIANAIHRESGERNLCLAGGVALNCVANTRIQDETPFEDVYIQPAAGDSGGALGAACYTATALLGAPRDCRMTDAYLGPGYAASRSLAVLRRAGVAFEHLEGQELLDFVAEQIAAGKIVGWFHGRLEFGPRALGHRSILADCRDPGMKDKLNERVKHRESFRPYGVSVPEEFVGEWFERGRSNPFMLHVDRIRPERADAVPSAVHVNGTSRLQTVTQEANGTYYDLARTFGELTGVPMFINTSFNDNNEPVVCTPDDALRCFQSTDMDCLVLDGYVTTRPDTRTEKDSPAR